MDISFLSRIANLLIQDINTKELTDGIKSILQEFTSVSEFSIYVYDNVTNTIRDCADNWRVIPDDSEIYKAYKDIQGEDFVINSKAYKLPASASGVSFKNRITVCSDSKRNY